MVGLFFLEAISSVNNLFYKSPVTPEGKEKASPEL